VLAACSIHNGPPSLKITIFSQHFLSRAGIHKACSRKKTDLKTDSFQTLFINAFLVVYLTFYKTDLSTKIFLTLNAVKFLPAVNG
jgi:hypothetical protein